MPSSETTSLPRAAFGSAPLLTVLRTGDGRVRYALRSKSTAWLLAGQCASVRFSAEDCARDLLRRMRHERYLRLAETPHGFVVELVTSGGVVLARSSAAQQRSHAEAKRRLIPIQAAAARVVLANGVRASVNGQASPGH